ncbi:MAG: hypothetical protein ACXWV9_08575 [Flavisolibacter sp.]
MGIGRREFLKLTSLALGGLAVNPLQAVVTNSDVYINKKLGILFHKPTTWEFVSIKDFGMLKKGQILGNGMDDFKDQIWEDFGDPICIITKYYPETPKNKGIFSPTITLHITPVEEFKDIEYENFKELMQMSEYSTTRFLTQFKVVKRHLPYNLSASKFYEYDAEYLFEHVDLKEPLKVELKVLKTEHNGFYYDFNCHQSSAANQTANKEFEQFKASIKLI